MGFSIITGNLLIGPEGDTAPGREYEKFTLTANPDGTRTLRTLTRSPRGNLLRDVTQTVAADWTFLEAYGRLFLDGVCVGSVMRQRVGEELESRLWRPGEAPDVARFPAPRDLVVGYHPVIGDAWKANFYDMGRRGVQSLVTLSVSNTWNGSSLEHGIPRESTMEFLGLETITVPAGTFETEHLVWHTRIDNDLHIWRHGPHNLLIQLTAPDRDTAYRLGSLEVIDVEEVPA